VHSKKAHFRVQLTGFRVRWATSPIVHELVVELELVG